MKKLYPAKQKFIVWEVVFTFYDKIESVNTIFCDLGESNAFWGDLDTVLHERNEKVYKMGLNIAWRGNDSQMNLQF